MEIETQGQVASESSQSSAPSASPETSAPAASPAASEGSLVTNPAAPVSEKIANLAAKANAAVTDPAAPVAAYEPNLKYRAGKEDREFDEWIRPVIKDAETEKKIREMYERAHGLDFVKKERDSVKTEFKTLRSQYQPLVKELQQVGTFVKEGDFGKAFELMGMKKEAVVNWLRSELEYEQLPPDQKARVDALRKAKDSNYERATEVETLRAQLEERDVSAVRDRLDQTMAHPKVVAAVEKFDQRLGKEGAFLEELITRGDRLYRETGKIVPPDEIAVAMMKMAGLWEEAPSESPNSPPPMTKPVVAAPPADKPTIKSFQAKAATPVKKAPRSLEDLKKLQQEMSGKRVQSGSR